MVSGGSPFLNPNFGQQHLMRTQGRLNDPLFNQQVSQALHAAFGANPATGQTLPGPISHLMDRMKGDFNQAGLSGLGDLFPGGSAPSRPVLPPLLGGGLNPFSQGPTAAGGANVVPAINLHFDFREGDARQAAQRTPHRHQPIMEAGLVAMTAQLISMMSLMMQTLLQGLVSTFSSQQPNAR